MTRGAAAPQIPAVGRAISLWAPPLVIMAAIFGLSHQPVLIQPPGSDKLVHLVAYAILAFAWGRTLGGSAWPRRMAFLGAALVAVTYGVSDEWHQGFVMGRDASVGDVVADTIRAWLGAALSQLLRWGRPAE